ncbi:MAG: penicillin-binding protein 1A [Alphaproteobacteria bacterium]|nr:penicillin-binding protein 1A [Alphaproteobacteria bacterium]
MRWLGGLFSFGLLLLVVSAGTVFLALHHYSKDLPDYAFLKDYQPPILTRIYADDGRMMATIAAEQRIFVPIKTIPPHVIDAFVSAEDQNFHQHQGVDFMGIARAAFMNLKNVGRDRHPMGASTITQQVAKNMLLSNEVSVARKVREIILAMRLEKSLSKERILELYLNEIFLGSRSYGVAAAALNYFNKSLDELTIAEAAYLAALPKAPNNYNPVRDHDAAVARRNWVLGRMEEDGRLTHEQAGAARAEPLQTRSRDEAETVSADYFTEEVRRQLASQFGEEKVLEGGLAVKTSLDPRLQEIAAQALREGLIDYDRRQRGWRGPVTHLPTLQALQLQLGKIALPPGGEAWQLAAVIGFKDNAAGIAFADGKRGRIPWSEMHWARREYPDDTFGPAVHKPSDVLNAGDVVMVEKVTAGEDGKPYPADAYTLRQVPLVQGAIAALDPHTGRVFAMSGGFSAKISQFNRATQAQRQPGSAFKPFVYMAALGKGFTPASLVLDAPFEYFQGPGLPLWRPENYSQQFYGATPLRVGIEKSRNVMTVRLANSIGMDAVVDEAKKFGIADDMPNLLSFSLGARETTVMRLTTAYGMIVNGGKKVTPSLIDRVQDRDGRTVWRQDGRACEGCQLPIWVAASPAPEIPDAREQIEDPRIAYQMASILEGVVQRGTGARMKGIGFPLAGKTGTTNESRDAWFVGFTPDLVCGVYMGFDDPKSLGSHETGASVAIPVFQKFMSEAMKGKPAIPFRVPPGLRMVRVNPATEALAPPSDKDAIWEAFVPGTEPQEGDQRPVLDGSVTGIAAEGAAAAGLAPAPTVAPIPGAGVPAAEGSPAASVPTVPVSPATQGTGGLY